VETYLEEGLLGKVLHQIMTAVTILFLIALVASVGMVILVVVGPVLLEMDILAEPLYTRIEDFLRRMLLYIIVSAAGYAISSWGRRLTAPERGGRAWPSPGQIPPTRP
jgi:hypothetical protein